ncbi:hypothetical protein AB0F17_41225 [Nonomuraea sp. NPDC026600]|uniref:hypothetical protein n=1 Tax=Nonomuraea sp. NPDC026600 TaxID=3155363 RepID=UPI00340037D3
MAFFKLADTYMCFCGMRNANIGSAHVSAGCTSSDMTEKQGAPRGICHMEGPAITLMNDGLPGPEGRPANEPQPAERDQFVEDVFAVAGPPHDPAVRLASAWSVPDQLVVVRLHG